MSSSLNRALKVIYKYIPFKKELFSLYKKFGTPPETVYKHLHFHGIIEVPIDKNYYFKMRHYGFQLENDVFWSGLNGNWERESTGIWIKLCKQSNVIFDIGANTGIYSLIAKTLNPVSKIYAFEPVNRVFEKLVYNNILNHFDIECSSFAVSNYDGEGIIYDSDSEHTYSVTVNKKLISTSSIETKVRTITLDSFIEQNNIANIDLMKIDVESHEAEVLQGFKKFLNIHKPSILIEILFEEVGENVMELLKDLDYQYFHIDEQKGIKHSEILAPHHPNYNFLICQRSVAEKIGLVN